MAGLLAGAEVPPMKKHPIHSHRPCPVDPELVVFVVVVILIVALVLALIVPPIVWGIRWWGHWWGLW